MFLIVGMFAIIAPFFIAFIQVAFELAEITDYIDITFFGPIFITIAYIIIYEYFFAKERDKTVHIKYTLNSLIYLLAFVNIYSTLSIQEQAIYTIIKSDTLHIFKAVILVVAWIQICLGIYLALVTNLPFNIASLIENDSFTINTGANLTGKLLLISGVFSHFIFIYAIPGSFVPLALLQIFLILFPILIGLSYIKYTNDEIKYF
ncbi:MAG: hypothetical protein ACK5LV_04310 [Lachnospirales bacterium]